MEWYKKSWENWFQFSVQCRGSRFLILFFQYRDYFRYSNENCFNYFQIMYRLRYTLLSEAINEFWIFRFSASAQHVQLYLSIPQVIQRRFRWFFRWSLMNCLSSLKLRMLNSTTLHSFQMWKKKTSKLTNVTPKLKSGFFNS